MSLADDVELAVKTYNETGSKAEAARRLGLPITTLKTRLDIAERGNRRIDTPPAKPAPLSQNADFVHRYPNTSDIPNSRNENVPQEIYEYLNRPKQGNSCHVRPNAKRVSRPVTHCVIPDVQAKPGVPLDHLRWAGEYIAEKRPDVIVQIGDFCDFESLSSYDRGKKSAENKRYKADLEAAHKAMELLMTPIVKAHDYHPRLVLTLGNHEDRLNRFIDDNAALDGAMSMSDLGYEAWGWEVIPFLKPEVIDGISYCHYFYQPNTGKPYGGSNLETRLKTIGHSFTMGHQQGLLTAIRDLSNGTRQRGLVAGSFYQHFESYRSHQANSHWQGIIFKHQVENGNYDLMELSLDFLRRRYA